MNTRGFTLVELLVVIALLGGLSIATSRVFFSQLKGTEKTQNLLELRQAGDQALLTTKKKIRSAQSVSGSCTAGMSSITIASRAPTPGAYTDAATFETTFTCASVLTMSENAGSAVNLTPENMQLSVCSFDCVQNSGSPAKVTINFSLDKGDTTQDFSSTVSLRNF